MSTVQTAVKQTSNVLFFALLFFPFFYFSGTGSSRPSVGLSMLKTEGNDEKE